MENEAVAGSLLWEVSLSEFILVTGVLGGGASYLAGRAVAAAWQPMAQLVVYVLLLTAATRFIHFSLFAGSLLTLHYFIVDFIVLLILGMLGRRLFRVQQMATQYSFAFDRAGPFAWRRKG